MCASDCFDPVIYCRHTDVSSKIRRTTCGEKLRWSSSGETPCRRYLQADRLLTKSGRLAPCKPKAQIDVGHYAREDSNL